MPGLEEDNHKKRKLDEVQEIEIDVSAPEPPSKKALRKAKKKGIDPAAVTSSATKDETGTETKTEATQTQHPPKNRSDYGVWIGNLSFTTTKDDLRKFFISNCSFSDATITRIHLPMGPSKFNGTPQNKGFAYVDFSNEKAMNEAVGLSEQLVAGRRVLIKGSKNFEGRPDRDQQAGSSKASGHPPSRRIFIGNLGFDATKELLQEHFSPCGPITMAHVATFEDTGKCKGYAWVEFETLEAAESAVKGFVKVPEDDDDEEEDEETGSDAEDEPKKARKPKTRKVWVNRFLGRQLRMEFAEDAATRYKKRYGKDAKGKGKGMATDGEELDGNDATNGDSGEGAKSNHAPKERRPRKENQKPSRYSKETVQRLTGAIVEAQGKKITFDES
jgi:RNA recognition motif-containing protein